MSKIEWTDKTWNPIVGCSKVSAGCKNCYAERMANRLAKIGTTADLYSQVVNDNGKWNGKVVVNTKATTKPLKWKKQSRIFVNSMSDLFHESLSDVQIAEIMQIMLTANWHTYQVLTKRPKRMMEFLNKFKTPVPEHIWFGVSVEDQATANHRLPYLINAKCRTKFVSAEPLLGPIDFNEDLVWPVDIGPINNPIISISQIIVGGESGIGARPIEWNWVSSIHDQCRERGIAFFFKQWGGVNKKKNGRILNGKEYNEMPEQLLMMEGV